MSFVDVVILFNQPSPRTHREDRRAEAGVLETVHAAAGALVRAGYRVEILGLADDFLPLVERIRSAPAVVLNFCESFHGRSAGEAYVASLLELLEVPYTGSSPDAMCLCLNKILTKRLLAGSGLPTPPFLEVESADILLSDGAWEAKWTGQTMLWPVVVKPVAEDASQGVHQSSIARSIEELCAAVPGVAHKYGYPVLIEHYIAGREFNVAVIEDPVRRALPVTEIVFQQSCAGRWPIVTYEAKWLAGGEEDQGTQPTCPAELDAETARELARLALEAARLTGCRDYARIDFRLSADGIPFILEVNANPDLSPSAGLSRQLAAAGISYDAFMVGLTQRAARRGATGERTSHRGEPAESRQFNKINV